MLLTLVSVLVFGVTAFAWATIAKFNSSLTTADVIGSGDAENPRDGAVDILLVGMDSRSDAQGNPLPKKLLAKLHAGPADGEINTDTLMLVHIPNNGRKASAVSIPRDSYVNIPGHGRHKINSAFGRGKAQARNRLIAQGNRNPRSIDVQSNQAGAKLAISTVEGLTGTTIDHYAQVNLVGFYDISKAVGGVPVCLRHDVDDSEYSGAVFHKGEQTIQGAKALAFVRQRHNIPGGSTDLQRNRRQQAFLASMAHKVLSAGTLANPSAVNSLIEAVRKSLVIDKNWDITSFAQQMQNLTGGSLKFATIPVRDLELDTPDGTAVQVDPQQVAKFVRNEAGQPSRAKPKPKPSAHARPNTAATRQVRVDVRNGTDSSGMAAAVLQSLAGKGFTAGNTGNTDPLSSTVISYPEGGRAQAQLVAGALGGSYEMESDDSLPPGSVQVSLGSDYSGPGADGVASASSSSPDSSSDSDSSDSSSSPSSSSSSSESPGSDTGAPPAPPITADGTTCVD